MPESTQLLINNLRIDLDARDEDPVALAAAHLGVPRRDVITCEVVRRSLDARRGRPRFVLTLKADVDHPPDPLPPGTSIAPPRRPPPPVPEVGGERDVVVVGAGPAGLFAALRLTEAGIRPVILDRGKELAGRQQDVSRLLSSGHLDPESNLHFGMGGAGTFSDGKLFTRLHQPLVRHVLEVLQESGAGTEDEILVDAQPHVGSDRWPATLTRLRAELESRGCSFRFSAHVTGIRAVQRSRAVRGEASAGRLGALTLTDGRLACEAAILAPGNSARDLFEALPPEALAPKALAVGVRMVHPQALVDRIQYGRSAGHAALGPATYRLTGRAAGRGIYTFCMCPGGVVVPTPTEPGRLCLNGMSNRARSSGEANAAVVVTVGPDDLDDPHDPLTCLRFQRSLEAAAFDAGGGGYLAPAQALGEFLLGEPTRATPACNYRPGVAATEIGALLPGWLVDPLRKGLADFCRRMPGLDDPAAVILGLETRTSSPVRILRSEDGQSPWAAGLFPAGEGSGYAGGIVSSAVDGIRAADALIAWIRARG